MSNSQLSWVFVAALFIVPLNLLCKTSNRCYIYVKSKKLCYNWMPIIVQLLADEGVSLTGSCLIGDRNATHILDCLAFIVSIYGQQIIVLQYLQHASDIVSFVHIFGQHISIYAPVHGCKY